MMGFDFCFFVNIIVLVCYLGVRVRGFFGLIKIRKINILGLEIIENEI